jgi:hypothetical protein
VITNIEVREVHTIIRWVRKTGGRLGRNWEDRDGWGGTGDSVEGGEDFFDYVEPEGDEVDDLVSHENHPRLQDNLSISLRCFTTFYAKGWRSRHQD